MEVTTSAATAPLWQLHGAWWQWLHDVNAVLITQGSVVWHGRLTSVPPLPPCLYAACSITTSATPSHSVQTHAAEFAAVSRATADAMRAFFSTPTDAVPTRQPHTSTVSSSLSSASGAPSTPPAPDDVLHALVTAGHHALARMLDVENAAAFALHTSCARVQSTYVGEWVATVLAATAAEEAAARAWPCDARRDVQSALTPAARHAAATVCSHQDATTDEEEDVIATLQRAHAAILSMPASAVWRTHRCVDVRDNSIRGDDAVDATVAAQEALQAAAWMRDIACPPRTLCCDTTLAASLRVLDEFTHALQVAAARDSPRALTPRLRTAAAEETAATRAWRALRDTATLTPKQQQQQDDEATAAADDASNNALESEASASNISSSLPGGERGGDSMEAQSMCERNAWLDASVRVVAPLQALLHTAASMYAVRWTRALCDASDATATVARAANTACSAARAAHTEAAARAASMLTESWAPARAAYDTLAATFDALVHQLRCDAAEWRARWAARVSAAASIRARVDAGLQQAHVAHLAYLAGAVRAALVAHAAAATGLRASLHTGLPAPLDSVWVLPSPPPPVSTAVPAAAADAVSL